MLFLVSSPSTECVCSNWSPGNSGVGGGGYVWDRHRWFIYLYLDSFLCGFTADSHLLPLCNSEALNLGLTWVLPAAWVQRVQIVFLNIYTAPDISSRESFVMLYFVFTNFRVNPLVKVVDQSQREATSSQHLLHLLLNEALTGNCRTVAIFCIHPPGDWRTAVPVTADNHLHRDNDLGAAVALFQLFLCSVMKSPRL